MLKVAGLAQISMCLSLRLARHLTLSFLVVFPSFQYQSSLACKLLTAFLKSRPFQHLLRAPISHLIALIALPDHPDTAYTSEPFTGRGASLSAPCVGSLRMIYVGSQKPTASQSLEAPLLRCPYR